MAQQSKRATAPGCFVAGAAHNGEVCDPMIQFEPIKLYDR
jgi:hypothetical protein